MKIQLNQPLAIASLAFAIWTLPQTAQANTIVRGVSQTLGQGSACSYVVLDDQGQISDLGVILSESALSSVPTQATELNLALPQQAIATPFTHISVNWNPEGHLPTPIYGTPHFDFHFFTIPQASRQQITATEADRDRAYKAPLAAFVPAGYQLAPDSAVPTEGVHWVNLQAPEFQGSPHGFDHTFIYGFYDGQLIFWEPMVSLAALKNHESFSETIARPDRYRTSGFYPTAYSITYDAQAHEYQISLDHFQKADE